MKSSMLVAALGAVALWNTPSALADACRNVEIHVHDDVFGDIKVVDLDYFDVNSGIWREENFVGNGVVDGDYQFERDLEYVDNEDIHLRVWYRWRSSDINPWSAEEFATTWPVHCDDGDHVDIHVDNITPPPE